MPSRSDRSVFKPVNKYYFVYRYAYHIFREKLKLPAHKAREARQVVERVKSELERLKSST